MNQTTFPQPRRKSLLETQELLIAGLKRSLEEALAWEDKDAADLHCIEQTRARIAREEQALRSMRARRARRRR